MNIQCWNYKMYSPNNSTKTQRSRPHHNSAKTQHRPPTNYEKKMERPASPKGGYPIGFPLILRTIAEKMNYTVSLQYM